MQHILQVFLLSEDAIVDAILGAAKWRKKEGRFYFIQLIYIRCSAHQQPPGSKHEQSRPQRTQRGSGELPSPLS